jgi:hypothetical protein
VIGERGEDQVAEFAAQFYVQALPLVLVLWNYHARHLQNHRSVLSSDYCEGRAAGSLHIFEAAAQDCRDRASFTGSAVQPVREQFMLVVIPPDYETKGIIPICISDVDDDGRVVHRGWIEAVPRVADRLRSLARNVIGDAMCVSELTEGSVHSLNALHGEKFGRSPSRRIYVDAWWRAKDIAAGGRRARVGREIELKEQMLACMREPYDFARAFEDREFMERLEVRLDNLGMDDLKLMLQLYLSDAEDQIPRVFGIEPNSRERNTLSQRWRRGIRKAFNLL